MIAFLQDREIYARALLPLLAQVRERLWIATADIKDLHIERDGAIVPFLARLADLVARGIEVRLIHAKEPGPRFREDFDRHPVLATGLDRVLCPRVHFKCIIADGRAAYFGSANLTGAGMGTKSPDRRNFENGILTDDPALLAPLCEQFDSVWRGARCPACRRKDFCGDGRLA